jgi:hypothetical protein
MMKRVGENDADFLRLTAYKKQNFWKYRYVTRYNRVS